MNHRSRFSACLVLWSTLAAAASASASEAPPGYSWARAVIEPVEIWTRDLVTGQVRPWASYQTPGLSYAGGVHRLADGEADDPALQPYHTTKRHPDNGSQYTEVALPVNHVGDYNAGSQTWNAFSTDVLPAQTEMSLRITYHQDAVLAQHPVTDPVAVQLIGSSIWAQLSSNTCDQWRRDTLSFEGTGQQSRSGSFTLTCSNATELDQHLWLSWSAAAGIVTAAMVPEPTSYALLVAGLACLAWRRSQGQRRSRAGAPAS
ncbi:PEP-CTERM sorting domain-containing protein [Eleftheria terrae]|uniref:PEP-CTERM sorting domain-containing protein n=1 Tax=Eleftheria terrae TaxID=1597781 RepID=UPI00263B6C8F|nr:PEP-CTERM sorting domain-containing protein [Eleftheria terrae]WKB55911.1 PEP-CTERM sorting domain-containing protein [Eleftheria terrae]